MARIWNSSTFIQTCTLSLMPSIFIILMFNFFFLIFEVPGSETQIKHHAYHVFFHALYLVIFFFESVQIIPGSFPLSLLYGENIHHYFLHLLGCDEMTLKGGA